MSRVTHKFPRLEWTPCSEPPSEYRRVLVVHRCRPWCRFNRIIVGWWNTEEWKHDDSNFAHTSIYQPIVWRDVELPKL